MEFNLADIKDFGGVGLILLMSYMLAVRAGKFCAPLIRDIASSVVSALSTMSEQSKNQTRILDGLLSSVVGIEEDQRNHSIILDEVREIVKGQKCCQFSSSTENAG